MFTVLSSAGKGLAGLVNGGNKTFFLLNLVDLNVFDTFTAFASKLTGDLEDNGLPSRPKLSQKSKIYDFLSDPQNSLTKATPNPQEERKRHQLFKASVDSLR
jgi:hypothetical protein